MTISQDVLSHLIDLFDYVPFSNRNYIVDGNFESWINSSVSIGAATWTNSAATMYYCYSGVGGASTISLLPFNVGNEAAGMTSPIRNTMQFQQTTAATSSPVIQQNVESVSTLHGRSVTLSMWLWTTSGSIGVGSVFVNQVFGTGGSPSAGVYTAVPVSWTVTTTPQKFSVRIDLPSILGKTLGTNGNDYVAFGVNLQSGQTFSVRTAQWQVEQCSPQAPAQGRPTAFEYRGQAIELKRVQRYYHQIVVNQFQGNFPATFYSATNGYAKVILPEVMRATPTGVISGSGTWYRISNAVSLTSAVLNQVIGVEALLQFTGSGLTTTADMISNSSANPFTISFDARL